MDCKATQKKLPAYLENTLSGMERDLVSKHLSTCEACRKQLEWLVVLDKELKSMQEETPKPYLFTRMKARMSNEKQVVMWWQPAGYTIAASLVMGLMAGIVIGKLTITKTEIVAAEIGLNDVFNDVQLESTYQFTSY
ncbi:MAG TPA: zf-HC2 domain-containing protein [Saprospiraceae bacterium]|nr:zf-HC2 domain-containing protein [Saprospiraceae bacterium]